MEETMKQYKTYFLKENGNIFYIGVTGLTLEKRLKRHISLAKSNSDYRISRKIRKLLACNIEINMELNEIHSSKKEAFCSEISLIKAYRKTVALCNSTDGGDCGPILFGDKNPAKRPDVRRKISEAQKGKKRPDLSLRNKLQSSKKVAQYSMKGKLIQTYVSVSDASRQLNKKHSAIYNCCSNISNNAHGFVWRYINE